MKHFGGVRIGRVNRNTRRKPTPFQLRPPTIWYELNWDLTQAAEVGSMRLTAWVMERSLVTLTSVFHSIETDSAVKEETSNQQIQKPSTELIQTSEKMWKQYRDVGQILHIKGILVRNKLRKLIIFTVLQSRKIPFPWSYAPRAAETPHTS
jgi:hypothetical protein